MMTYTTKAGRIGRADRAGGPTDLSRCASQPKALIPCAEDVFAQVHSALDDLGAGLDELGKGLDGLERSIDGVNRAVIFTAPVTAAAMFAIIILAVKLT